MHDGERPVAMVSAILANQNLDPKKGQPKSYEDFSFYKPRQGSSGADYVYGSAMMKLAKLRLLPSWSLFCFKGVTASASPAYDPETAAFMAEDAILLHPRKNGDGWEGMLIARETASLSTRTFVDDHGNTFSLKVPHIHTKVVCEEGVTLNP